jgi:sRNA-binding carbon storage regulator CsrA
MRVYDIIIYLFLFAILTVMFSKLFDLLNIAISQIDMRNVTHYITVISNSLYQLTFYLLGLALILMVIDLIIRSILLKDQITNHIKSVYHTMVLRHYLKQDIDTASSKDWQQTGETKTNAVERYFNKVVGKSIVDVRQNEVRVAIKIPRKQQAHEILKTIEPQIHEEITHMHPNYYFSASQRHHRYLWFTGHKR